MPVYDYACAECGPFTVLRPMAEFRDPHACPDCGADAARALLSAPNLAGMDPGRRRAFAVNERSAHEPRSSSRHGAGCGCCSSARRSTRTAKATSGAKSFPSTRPWMISH